MVGNILFLDNTCWNGGKVPLKDLNFLVDGRETSQSGSQSPPKNIPDSCSENFKNIRSHLSQSNHQ